MLLPCQNLRSSQVLAQVLANNRGYAVLHVVGTAACACDAPCQSCMLYRSSSIEHRNLTSLQRTCQKVVSRAGRKHGQAQVAATLISRDILVVKILTNSGMKAIKAGTKLAVQTARAGPMDCGLSSQGFHLNRSLPGSKADRRKAGVLTSI